MNPAFGTHSSTPLYLRELLSVLHDDQPLPSANSFETRRIIALYNALIDSGDALEKCGTNEKYCGLPALRKSLRAIPRDVGTDPTTDIQGYASTATLPPLPYPRDLFQNYLNLPGMEYRGDQPTTLDRSPFNSIARCAATLDVSRDAYKPLHLRSLVSVSSAIFAQNVDSFSRHHLSGTTRLREAVDPDLPNEFDLDRALLEARGYSTPYARGRQLKVKHAPHIAIAVSSTLCVTANAILHDIDPFTAGWEFEDKPPESNEGGSNLKWWNPKTNTCRLIIHVQEPWSFNVLGLREIKRVRMLDPLHNASLAGIDKVLCVIRDKCLREHCFFFILTTYEYWCFGVFSTDYSTINITEPFAYNSREPTILAATLYWVESAMLVPGLYEVPMYDQSSVPPKLCEPLWSRAVRKWRKNSLKEIRSKYPPQRPVGDYEPQRPWTRLLWSLTHLDVRRDSSLESLARQTLQAIEENSPLSMENCLKYMVAQHNPKALSLKNMIEAYWHESLEVDHVSSDELYRARMKTLRITGSSPFPSDLQVDPDDIIAQELTKDGDCLHYLILKGSLDDSEYSKLRYNVLVGDEDLVYDVLSPFPNDFFMVVDPPAVSPLDTSPSAKGESSRPAGKRQLVKCDLDRQVEGGSSVQRRRVSINGTASECPHLPTSSFLGKDK
ncbi:hypothetical protein FRB99_008090 [Tulasnella sp. 403]|nr:hypothetical protein FRB99_008090 [Tulasnella sp. 403]